MVMRNPLLAASFLTLLLGASLIASGIIRTFIGIQIPTAGPKIFLLASSILTLLLGAMHYCSVANFFLVGYSELSWALTCFLLAWPGLA